MSPDLAMMIERVARLCDDLHGRTPSVELMAERTASVLERLAREESLEMEPLAMGAAAR